MKRSILFIVLAVATHFMVVSAFVQPALGKGQGNKGSNGGQVRRNTQPSNNFRNASSQVQVLKSNRQQHAKVQPIVAQPSTGQAGKLSPINVGGKGLGGFGTRKTGGKLEGIKVGDIVSVPPVRPVGPIGPIKPPVGPIGPIGPIKPPVGPVGPIGPIKPPVGPIGPIGPIKPPVGPIGPIGPIKPPVGPIGPIGPIKPPVGPIGPIGPIKPPVGPIGPIGPIKPPVGPIGPIGPIKPPVGPIGPIGPIEPPVGPVNPPVGPGGGGGGNCHPGNHCLPWWTSLCFSNCGGSYGYPNCPPVYCETPVFVACPSPAVTVIQPVVAEVAEEQPAAEEANLPQLHAGATVAVKAPSLGDQPGQVVLQVGDLALATQLKQWNPEGVVCVLPTMGLAKPVLAKLHTVRPDGAVAHSLTFELLPPRPQTPANQGPLAAEVNDR